ncbi:MAG: hypothetical protein P4L40_21740 [Terracidiphilus sp.]|nr:hypothetical protein [Terracidiphilus sp.]
MPPAKVASFLSSRLFDRLCAVVLYLFAAAAAFNGLQDANGFVNDTDAYPLYGISFIGAVTGTAQKPFIFRRLLPDTTNWVAAVTPQPIQDRLYHWFYFSDSPGFWPRVLSFGHSQTACDHVWFFRFFVFYISVFLSALLAILAMHLVCRALDLPPAVALFAPVVFMLLMPYILVFYYDFLELAFFMLAVWVALRCSWWWLLPLAALGAWNKESFLFFLPSLYPLLRQRLSRRMALTAVALPSLAAGAVYLYMRTRFPKNPMASAWLQWQGHLIHLANIHEMLVNNTEVYGIRLLSISTVVPTLMLLWLFAHAWRLLPAVVRRHALIAAAINFPLYLLFGAAGEYRNLSMLGVFALLVVAWTLKDALERATPRQSPV